MFQFPAFPIARSNCERIPIRRPPVLSLRAGPWSFSQLGTSVVGTRAELSTKWHSSHVVVHVSRSQWVASPKATWPPTGRRAIIDRHCDPGTGPVDVWIARTHGVIIRSWVSPGSYSTLPNRACAGWCIGLLRIPSSGRFPLKGVGPGRNPSLHGPTGIRTQGVLLAKEALYR